jgi:hypothetical protein
VTIVGGIARNIELYNSAYSLAWKHISEVQKREKPNIASRLHDSIRLQIKKGPPNLFSLPPKRLGMSSLTQKPGIKDRIRPSRTWIKIKNPEAPAATRFIDGTF